MKKLLTLLLVLVSLPALAINSADPKLPDTWGEGAYAWNSANLMNPQTRASELQLAQRRGIRHLYVGITAEQVKNKDQTHAQFVALTKNAWEYGVTISLLLGEPSWMNPESRDGLRQIIKDYSDIPFYSLQLDLEVEQIEWPATKPTLINWIDTVAVANNDSPWPLELTLHWRWFSKEFEKEVCVGCLLTQLGIKNVSMMTFTTNTDRISEIIESASKKYRSISFRTAQSVEPELDITESWNKAKDTNTKIQNLRLDLSNKGYTGIDWQNWDYFKHTEKNN